MRASFVCVWLEYFVLYICYSKHFVPEVVRDELFVCLLAYQLACTDDAIVALIVRLIINMDWSRKSLSSSDKYCDNFYLRLVCVYVRCIRHYCQSLCGCMSEGRKCDRFCPPEKSSHYLLGSLVNKQLVDSNLLAD